MSDNTISISQLKMNPAAAIAQAVDYPLEVISRGRSQAYLVSKKLFESIVEYLEDIEDNKSIAAAKKSGELKQATDYEEFAKTLGL
jgi:antitoxin StbD